MMSIIITIILLGQIILLHEFGHFITAKAFKMPVIEFAIGMGPKLISIKKGETNYSIRALPLGGFVNIDGMQIEDDPSKVVKNGFNSQSPVKRFVVLVAGVVMNFLSAILVIYVLVLGFKEVPSKFIPTIVNEVSEKSYIKDKIIPGDKIVSLDGKSVKNLKDLSIITEEIASKGYKDTEIQVEVIRNNKVVKENIKLMRDEKNQSIVRLGITTELPKKIGVLEGVKIAFYTFGQYLKMMVDGLGMLVTGKVSMNEVTGPVGLTSVVGQVVNQAGYFALLNLFVLLSINIGLMNLLPIPALDGGRLIFVLLELVGIKVNKKIEEKLHFVGIVLLMGLMLLIISNDIRKFL